MAAAVQTAPEVRARGGPERRCTARGAYVTACREA
jgi:hypothetical protein